MLSQVQRSFSRLVMINNLEVGALNVEAAAAGCGASRRKARLSDAGILIELLPNITLIHRRAPSIQKKTEFGA